MFFKTSLAPSPNISLICVRAATGCNRQVRAIASDRATGYLQHPTVPVARRVAYTTSKKSDHVYIESDWLHCEQSLDEETETSRSKR